MPQLAALRPVAGFRMSKRRTYALLSMVVVGVVLILLGISAVFTVVTCVPNGSCIGFVGYDWLSEIAGIVLVVVGGAKLFRTA
jgi:hypothetical protein